MGAHHIRLNQRQSTNRNRRVFSQTLWTLGAQQDRNKPLDQRWDPLTKLGVCSHLSVARSQNRGVGLTASIVQRDLAHTPSSIIARAHKLDLGLGHNLLNELRHDLRDDRAQDREARNGHISNKRVTGLANRRIRVLIVINLVKIDWKWTFDAPSSTQPKAATKAADSTAQVE